MISRSAHGLPCAARPTITAAAPVVASTACARAREVTSPEAITGTSTSETSSAVSEWSAVPVYICFAERGWSVSDAAPASTSRGPTSRHAREPFSTPRRIFTETGSGVARRDRLDDPARVVGIVEQRGAGAGLRHLLDRAAEVHVDDVGAGGLDHPGRLGHRDRVGAEDLDRERMLVGGDPQVAERPLVAVLDPGHRDHLRADEPGAVAAALAAKRLHADAGHRREDEAARDLDAARVTSAREGRCSRSVNGSPAPLAAALDGAATIPARFWRAQEDLALKEVILTAEGYKKLQQEIDLLRGDKRREVAERIRVAREFGDIAENAEYDDAKNEQAMLEHKIAQLEERLLSARVITKKEISKDAVSVGSHVRLRDMQANKTFEYHIVGSAEANPAENKLSNESPVGKAIMGHKKGDVVEVTAPRGALKFKIMEIKAA